MGCCESILGGGSAYPGARARPPAQRHVVEGAVPVRRQQQQQGYRPPSTSSNNPTATRAVQQTVAARQRSSAYQATLHDKKWQAIRARQTSAAVRARKNAAVRAKMIELGGGGTPLKPPPPPTTLLKRDIQEYTRRSALHEPAARERAEDPAKFLSQAEQLIPADVIMISGCEDEQTSMDVGNAAGGLPDPKGRAGGAATSSLLALLYARRDARLTFQQALTALRARLAAAGLPQVPQLTASRPLDLDEREFAFHDPARPRGARRALLVGIKYEGQDGRLAGCANDAYHMRDYLVNVHGFEERDVALLTDDASRGHPYRAPTKQAMIAALQHLVAVSRPGDSVFFHYSGHGGFLEADHNSFKQKGERYDQTLIPLDHRRSGQIRDFNLFHHFVRPMARGVRVTCLMDCCHSGSVLDLPYSYKPTREGGGAYRERRDADDMAGVAYLAVLAGQVLDYHLFGSVMDQFSEALGHEWESEYSGLYEQELLDDAADDAEAGEGDGEVDAEVREDIARQVEDDIDAEIAREVEEGGLGAALEGERDAALEAEVRADVAAEAAEADFQRQEYEADRQRQAEAEAQGQEAEDEARQQQYYEEEPPSEEDYDVDDGGFGSGDY